MSCKLPSWNALAKSAGFASECITWPSTSPAIVWLTGAKLPVWSTDAKIAGSMGVSAMDGASHRAAAMDAFCAACARARLFAKSAGSAGALTASGALPVMDWMASATLGRTVGFLSENSGRGVLDA